MTAEPLLHARARASDDPPDAFLLKPFRREQLLEAVQDALGERRPEPREERISELKALELAHLLVDLAARGETGILRLRREGARRSVHLLNGVPVFIESTASLEALGVMLVHREVLDAAQWAAVQDRMIETSERPDEAAVCLGFVNRETMTGLLRSLSRARLGAALLETRGECSFERSAPFSDAARLSPLNPLALACDAVEALKDRTFLLDWAEQNADNGIELSDRGRPLSRYIGHLLRRPSLRAALEVGVPLSGLAQHLRVTDLHVAVICWTLIETGLAQWSERAFLKAQQTFLELAEALPLCPSGLIELPDSDVAAAEARPDPLAERVFEGWLRARGADHHAVLGVPAESGPEDIENAWLAISRQYHPDIYLSHPDPVVRRRARELFLRASTAYAALSNGPVDDFTPLPFADPRLKND